MKPTGDSVMAGVPRLRHALAALLAATAGAAGATPESYVIDPAHTFPQFEVSHLGFSLHRGRFNRSAGRVTLDAAARTGTIEVRIETASLDTGDEQLETILKSDAFFDAARHPGIIFRAARLHFEGERPTAAEGELTMRGVTRPLRLSIDHFRCGPVPVLGHWVCGANATATLRRSDFGIDRYLGFGLGDEVRLNIQVEARRETAPRVEP